MDTFTMVSYNCTGLYEDRVDFIRNFLNDFNVDVLFLQETWLHDSQFKKVRKISDGYLSENVCGIKDDAVIQSRRGYGGVSILWKQSLAQSIKPVKSNSKRLACIQLQLKTGYKILVINTYMPNDNYSQNNVDQDFEKEMSNIEQLCLSQSDINAVMLVGDMNVDLDRNNAHLRCLKDLCNRHGLVFTKNHPNAKYDHTYANMGAGHFSSIDHFIVPHSLSDYVESVSCIDTGLNPSFHFPLWIAITFDLQKLGITERTYQTKGIAWNRLTENEINQYKQVVSEKLSNIYVPQSACNCEHVRCSSVRHKHELSKYCHDLIGVCVHSGETIFPKVKHKNTQIPYWNECVKPLKDTSLFWKSIWESCGRPRDGVVSDIMRATKHKYHYTIRAIRKRQEDLRNSRMVECYLKNKNRRQFWKEYKKVEGKGRANPPHLDDNVDPKEIVNLLNEKYKTLYNSVPGDDSLMDDVKMKVNEGIDKYKNI